MESQILTSIDMTIIVFNQILSKHISSINHKLNASNSLNNLTDILSRQVDISTPRPPLAPKISSPDNLIIASRDKNFPKPLRQIRLQVLFRLSSLEMRSKETKQTTNII